MGAGEAACDLLMTSRLRSAAVADVGALQRRTAAVQIHLAFLFTPKVNSFNYCSIECSCRVCFAAAMK